MRIDNMRVLLAMLILTAFLLYTSSLFMPLMIVEQLYIFSDRVTFIGIIQALVDSGEWVLCIVIAIATIALPITKFALLVWQLISIKKNESKHRAYQWLMQLSRWSMLDVFVIAVFIVMLKTSFLSQARTGAGFYLFVSSILLVALVSILVKRQSRTLRNSSVQGFSVKPQPRNHRD